MYLPGLGGCRCVEKGARFLDPCFQQILALDFGWVLTFGSDLAKCDEKGLGRRGSRSFGHETLGSGMRWAG